MLLQVSTAIDRTRKDKELQRKLNKHYPKHLHDNE